MGKTQPKYLQVWDPKNSKHASAPAERNKPLNLNPKFEAPNPKQTNSQKREIKKIQN
jgi:hypothetical protein